MADKDESKITVHIKSTKQKIDIEILPSENVEKVMLVQLVPFWPFMMRLKG